MKVEIKNDKFGRTESATLQMDGSELATIRIALNELLQKYNQGQYAQSGLSVLRETYKHLIDMDAEIEAVLTGEMKSKILAIKGMAVLDDFWNEEGEFKE